MWVHRKSSIILPLVPPYPRIYHFCPFQKSGGALHFSGDRGIGCMSLFRTFSIWSIYFVCYIVLLLSFIDRVLLFPIIRWKDSPIADLYFLLFCDIISSSMKFQFVKYAILYLVFTHIVSRDIPIIYYLLIIYLYLPPLYFYHTIFL